jgi:NADH-quinone oxidoreductase subunit J
VSGEAIAFYILAGMVLAAALIVVNSRNVVHAAVSLIPVLLGVAGFYVLLHAEFLTVVQILIYAGGVTVLILFVVLLTEGATGVHRRQRNEQVPMALAASGVLAAVLLVLYGRTTWPRAPAALPAYNPGAVGESLFGPYVLAFVVVGIVILAVLVGAVVVARREE